MLCHFFLDFFNYCKKMNENQSEEIEKMIEFENVVFDCSDSSIEKAINLIKQFDLKYVQQLICSASDIKIYSFKNLGLLFKHTGNLQINVTSSLHFHCYLYKKGIIQKDSFRKEEFDSLEQNLLSIENYENPVQEGSLHYIIQNDLLQEFTDKVITDNIDIQHTFIKIFSTPFRLIDYACYCDAMNILKYMIVNDIRVTKWSTERAIQNGSENIIEFLSEKGYSFDNHLWCAIHYHQNDIAKWLFENYKHEDFRLSDCVFYFNTELLIYFIDNTDANINQQDYDQRTCLHYAVLYNNVILAKYLLNKGIDINIEDMSSKTALDLASSDEMKAIFNFNS